MIEHVEKGLKANYKFSFTLDKFIIERKKFGLLTSYEEIYSSDYENINNFEVKNNLMSHSIRIGFEDFDMSHGEDGKKLLYLVKIGQTNKELLKKFVGDKYSHKKLDDISLASLSDLMDYSCRKAKNLSELKLANKYADVAEQKTNNNSATKEEKKEENYKKESSVVASASIKQTATSIKQTATSIKQTATSIKQTATSFINGVLTFDDEITNLGNEDIENYENVLKVIFPKNIKEISSDFFLDQSSIKEVDFSKVSKLKVIPSQLFEDLKNISEIIIPEGVEKIEDDAFNKCKNLRKIILPSTLKEIDFLGDCPNLEEVDTSKVHLLKSIPDNFIDSENKIQTFIIPIGVEEVGSEILYKGTKTLFVPSTVKKISYLCSSNDTDFTVYLYSDDIDDLEGLVDGVSILYVHEFAFERYQEMIEDYDCEIELRSMPDDAPYVSEDYEQSQPVEEKEITTDKSQSVEEKVSTSANENVPPVIPEAAKPAVFKYYIVADGKQEGPYDEVQFGRLVEYGMVKLETYVWTDGMPQWQPAGSVAELNHFFAIQNNDGGMPPLPVQ